MRVKALFISTVIGIAVVTGIFKGLTSPRSGANKEKGEKEGDKEKQSTDLGKPDGC